MLRRKLLWNLGPLVALLLLTAIVAIWLLQGVLADLNLVRNSADQQALLARFRTLVLGLAFVFVVIINISVIVLTAMSRAQPITRSPRDGPMPGASQSSVGALAGS